MRGALAPLPRKSPCRGACLTMGYVFRGWYLVKPRDNFTSTLRKVTIDVKKSFNFVDNECTFNSRKDVE
jgi:hypothetical protein